MQQQGLHVTREQAEIIKCKYGEVAKDYDAQLKTAREHLNPEPYELPNGQKIHANLKAQCLMCPEQLFQPKDSMDAKGIHNYTFDAVMKCDPDIKRELFRNIVLAGGSTMFRGMKERMKKEICALAPSPMQPEVETPADRKYSCWLGGAILSKIEKFDSMWITKKEFDERGKGLVVHEKCF